MKIYQIHKCVGEYEDYSDTIIGTYLHKQKADKVLKKLKIKAAKIRQKYYKCNACVACRDSSFRNVNIKPNCKNYIPDIYGYCKSYNIVATIPNYNLVELKVCKDI